MTRVMRPYEERSRVDGRTAERPTVKVSEESSIIGLPWARAALNIGVYTLLPFGFKAVDRDEHLGRGDIGTGPLGGADPDF